MDEGNKEERLEIRNKLMNRSNFSKFYDSFYVSDY